MPTHENSAMNAKKSQNRAGMAADQAEKSGGGAGGGALAGKYRTGSAVVSFMFVVVRRVDW